ncbi:transmembrane gamma-carboxyglutamic acid protein 1 [Engraulis encrasicolus]|uniref:transmembrane gamma-carboxyglutamic acid protein 1 n=1 Tax=Engraulis encrasicolus TaxID=184585 RepID=UPI002FD5279A
MGTVFLPQSTAHSVLTRLRRANYFLEEVKQGSIQRECREEICTYEEAREAFENDEKTRRFWEEYVREQSPNSGLESMVGGAQLLYLILPLLLVLVLILAVTITVWKCHARKRSPRSPLSVSHHHHHRDPTLSVVSMDQWGDMSPRSELSARSSLGFRSGDGASSGGRTTSAGDPPPSYDEAVGHADVHIETEPPPQYDDIVTNSSDNTIIGHQGK